MANATTPPPQLPNPLTPLAFFPPELALATNVSFYTSIGSLAVYIWDILDNLENDYKLVTKYRVTFPTVVYVLARWLSLTYLLSDVVMSTAAIGNCRTHGLRIGWTYPVAIGATALLCVFRVRSVYNGNKFVTVLFAILWLGILGGTATIPINARASAIGTTKYCSTDGASSLHMSANGVLQFVFDAAVYMAITLKLVREFYDSKSRSSGRIRTIFTSENLTLLTTALLEDGQGYYLTTTAVQLMSMILLNIHSLPLPYRSIVGLPAQVVMNIMACRVYRRAKFGHFSRLSVIPPGQITVTGRNKTAAIGIHFGQSRDHKRSDVELGGMPAIGKPEQSQLTSFMDA